MRKMRLSPAGLKQTRERVTKMGESSGFDFNYHEDMRKPNTLYSHILLDYAKAFGKQTELKVRLQEAYFTEQKNIGLKSVLYEELKAVGLDADEAIAQLDNVEAIRRVQSQESYWKSLGVSSIPTMVFEGKGSINGARSVQVYKNILNHFASKKVVIGE